MTDRHGWSRVFRGNRTLWIVAAAAVVSLVGGLLVGRFVISPADAAASGQAPPAGLITVPVEFGELSNDVVARGDVGYADPVEVTIDTAGGSGPAVVTGGVPTTNAILDARSVALEVAGRPVIVLPGELPPYRTLRVGVSGPDVVQLKQALAAVGIDPGDAGSSLFDAATASAVARLYAAVGYPAPEAAEGAAETLRSAQRAVQDADAAIQAATADVHSAAAGPSAVEVMEADNAVATARRELASARTETPPDPNRVADLNDAVRLAELRRAQLDHPVDASSQQAALASARAQREAAVEALEAARRDTLPHLPAGEVLFLTQLPRRVDDVAVKRGEILSGPAMTVSGAEMQIGMTVSADDAELLKVDMKASFELPDGEQHTATISKVEPPQKSGERWSVTLVPEPLTPEQIASLKDANVKVTISVGATEGEVLKVPVAALTAGPGGEARVEVAVGDPRDGADAETRLVTVKTGLAAGGYVEVVPIDDELDEGDLVVVGR